MQQYRASGARKGGMVRKTSPAPPRGARNHRATGSSDWVERLGRSEVSPAPLQGNGPWSEVDYRNGSDMQSDAFNPASAYNHRNGSDIDSDAFNAAMAYDYRNGMDVQSDRSHDAREEQEWTAQSDLIQDHRLNELPQPADSQAWIAMTPDEVEQQVLLDLLGEQAREDSVHGADLLLTGGPSRGGAPRGGIAMVRNGNWDAALNIGADPFGLLPDLVGMHQDLDKLNRIQLEGSINDMRQRMKDAGMKDVPTDYRQSLLGNGSTVKDYGATIDDLQTRYEGFVRDSRLRQTWGDDYPSVRIGKSQMTVQEFEKRALDLQQNAADRAYEKGKELIARGEIPVKEGDYARALGSYIDERVRLDLRFFARAEGINDSMTSSIWGVNRSIRSDLVDGRGIPDNRLGYNLLADTSLAPKDGNTEQLRRWGAIRPGANYIIIRPSNMPGGGAYVIPHTTIQPYNMPSRALGRSL